jgi:multiple sugar transport system substrate-binding protein
MPDLSGISLGRYQLIKPLGEGGMAVVYKAYDTRLECDVAVKFIRTDKLPRDAEANILKRFEREAKAVAKLTHSNIVKVMDYGEYEGTPYLVMPLLPGGTLKQFTGQQGQIPWQEAAKLLMPIADALGYAHSEGIIHRDVKPSNILLTKSGVPMLTDFGVAKIIEEDATQGLTGTNATIGTPEYMAPEQIASKSIDARADIYALGVVFYEMITGRRPFEADTPMAVMIMHSRDPLPNPSKFIKDLPDQVEKFLLKALAKSPDDRYQSMAEFMDGLKKLEKNEPTEKRPQRFVTASKVEPSEKPVKTENKNLVDVTERTFVDQILKPKKQKTWPIIVGGIGLIGIIALVFALTGGFLPRSNSPVKTEITPKDTSNPVTSLVTDIPHSTSTLAPGEKIVLNVWSFTNEIQTMAIAFEKTRPDVDVVYTMIPMTNGEYQTKLMATLGTDQVPDVVALEASFVKSYVESDFLADLSSLDADIQKADVYPFVTEVGTFDGVLKALSYQATPGALFYRRSLAKEYFGTDDPVEMQKILGDMDKYVAAAEVVKTKSGGNTYMVSSSGDFMNLFYANRAQPWIVDNTLTVDPMVNKLVATAKTFRDNGYESKATQWTEGWFAGMNDTLKDAAGNPKKIFSYFLPTWGLPYVLSPNATSTDKSSTTVGDWAMITGPLPYQWGGSWLGAMKDSKHLELAKEFIRFCTLDETNLTNWATGVYTNEYLKAIDPNTPEGQSQAAGDFVGSKVVVNKITAGFDNSTLSQFLGGENSYGIFAAAAPFVNGRLMQGSDDAIQRAFNDPLASYLEGTITEDEMWKTWKDAVRNEFPDLIIN